MSFFLNRNVSTEKVMTFEGCNINVEMSISFPDNFTAAKTRNISWVNTGFRETLQFLFKLIFGMTKKK